ncbi:MAG: hypothetical protein AAB316_03920, partial [Bacteroidota bacterium]
LRPPLPPGPSNRHRRQRRNLKISHLSKIHSPAAAALQLALAGSCAKPVSCFDEKVCKRQLRTSGSRELPSPKTKASISNPFSPIFADKTCQP